MTPRRPISAPASRWLYRALVGAALTLAAGALAGDFGPIPKDGRVVKVYDGDTLTLESGDKIRLRWVNTPELKPAEPFGQEARQLAADLVLDRPVTLAPAPDGRDGYGRVVAGVFAGTTNLSLELVRAGYAHVFLIPPDDVDPSPLLAAQKEARDARRGIFSLDEFRGALRITSFHANAPGDDARNLNGEYLRMCNLLSEPVQLAGFRLRNREGRVARLPEGTVPPGYTVLVHTGSGTAQLDPAKQIEVFMGETTPMWDDDMDVATLIAPDGTEIQHRPSKAY